MSTGDKVILADGEFPTNSYAIKVLQNASVIICTDGSANKLSKINKIPDFIIGEGEYFFLGDNRDNSLDSRFDRQFGGVGLVSKEYLIGKASLILFSSRGGSIFYFWTWRKDRFFKVIR